MTHPEGVRPSAAQPYQGIREGPVRFDTALQRELDCIKVSRQRRGIQVEAHPDNLIGLAFSGGGIRSATFNLGILQALAEKSLLRNFDYLSTVSGGGYIGSWLAAITYRLTREPNSSFDEVERKLKPQTREAPFVNWLRLYSNYLTPYKGIAFGDTWAVLGTWMRSVILNQTILGILLAGILLLCQAALMALIRAENDGMIFFVSSGVLFLLATVSMGIDVESSARDITLPSSQWITIGMMLPFIACVTLNCALWQRTDLGDSPTLLWAAAGAASYLVAWCPMAVVSWVRRELLRRSRRPARRMISIAALLLFAPMAGALGGCLLRVYVKGLRNLPAWTNTNEVVVVFGSSVVMLILLIVGFFHLGLVGRNSKEIAREWWAGQAAYTLLVTLGWLILMGTVVFGPLAIRWVLFEVGGWSLVVGLPLILCICLSVIYIRGRKHQIIADMASWVFCISLILVLETALCIATGLLFEANDTQELWGVHTGLGWRSISDQYWDILESGSPLLLAGLGCFFVLLGLVLSWRVDVNEFSLHHFYRNRLVRCYLGASNPDRRPQPLVRFDPADDLPLCMLSYNYPGPYPILNAALNITSRQELGYATRQAKSFVFTPLYCGYDLSDTAKASTVVDLFKPSFAKTEEGGRHEGISLGTAMAISGAAASPNMGYFTSRATAFFMALFAVRLGWWMGNPRYLSAWRSVGPRLGLTYFLSELFAQSDQQRRYVYLSDGGHFENLGIYELLRRRCRLIVASDAGCDPNYKFEDLRKLIEKARADFGARIEIDYAAIRPPDGGRESYRNYVVGTIYYDSSNVVDTGTLIFIKASMPMNQDYRTLLVQRLPDEVWRYYDQHRVFPHESTVDQWFDDLQFESYRALGEYVGLMAGEQIRAEIDHTLARPEPRLGASQSFTNL
ncbi:MAG TPA: patatin-like phospholipase family protein [Candidatus Sulfotelmatobacter sp.]|nr:patatin-like phospholipase family protein [Candidatus Sulfotelmatobacter sp.]